MSRPGSLAGAIALGVVLAGPHAHAGMASGPSRDLPLVTARSPHFVVRHRQEISSTAAAATLAVLEEGLASVCAELGLTLDAPVEVLLLDPSVFRALTGSPVWVRGVYDGRILLRVAAGPDGRVAPPQAPLLLHELTHAVLRRAIPAPLPPWFEEGLAERFEGTTPQAAAAWLRERRAPAFAGLEAIDADIRAGGWREDAGHQRARLALQALVECAGAGAPARLVAAVRSGRPPAQALDEVVPGGAAALEARLRDGSP